MEIKFRGYSKDKFKFVYGNLLKTDIGYIICNDYLELDRLISFNKEVGFSTQGIKVEFETVGQYIGLKDINNIEIYEGDILNIHCHMGTSKIEIENMNDFWLSYDYQFRDKSFEIIGNKHLPPLFEPNEVIFNFTLR